MDELIEKYKVKAKTLLQMTQIDILSEFEIEKVLVARRFVTEFLEDLKQLNK